MLAQLQADTRETEIELIADENNIYRWTGYLQVRIRAAQADTSSPSVPAAARPPDAPWPQGPVGTPYEGGTFQVAVNVPQQYPLTPPAVKFVTKVRCDNPRATCLCVGAHAVGRHAAAGVPPQRALEGAARSRVPATARARVGGSRHALSSRRVWAHPRAVRRPARVAWTF